MHTSFSSRFVKYFLDNRQLTILLLIIVILGGLFSFSQTRIEGFPSIPVPVIVVNTILPGAGPETIEATVTTPLENALADLKNLKEYSSTSQNNVSTIILTLKNADDINAIAQEAQTKIDTVTLPDSATDPTVFVPEVGGPVFIMGIAGGLPLDDLLEHGEVIVDELESVDGIGSIDLFSNIENKYYVELRPEYQNPDIINQIKAANVTFPLGQTRVNGSEVPLAGARSITTLEDLRTLPITIQDRFGRSVVVALTDIARVYETLDFGGQVHRIGYRPTRTSSADGQVITEPFTIETAVLYNVTAQEGIDVLELEQRFLEKVDQIKQDKQDIDVAFVFNQADQSRRQIDEIREGAFGSKWNDSFAGNFGYAFGGIWLLTIAMFLLVDWRSALISIFTIPLSFLFTFLILYLFGIQFNTIVLFSMVLVLGLVIDPAIVVLESIKRYTEIGYRGAEAALRAVAAVGKGVFIAVFTSFVVFVPFAIVGGTFGEIIRYIPLTVIPALIASYVVPMVFLTWLGVKFLKPKEGEMIRDENDPSDLWWISRLLIRINRWILEHIVVQWVVIILGIAVPLVIVGALFGSGKVQQVQFSQAEDIEFISINVPLPPNATNADRLTVARDVEELVLQEGENFVSYAYLNFEGETTTTGGPQSLSVFAELLQPGDREDTSKEITDRIETQLVVKYGERARADEAQNGPPAGIYPVGVEIFHNDPHILRSASERVATQLQTYDEVAAVQYDGQNTTTELTVVLNEDEVARRGLSAPAVYGQIAGVLGETTLFELDDTEVIARYAINDKPDSIAELEALQVFGPTGPVRLDAIATIQNQEVAGAIQKINGQRFVRVGARVDDLRDVIDLQREIDDWALDNLDLLGVSERDLEDRRGQDEFEESFEQLFAAIAFSIIITYVIFVVFFKSFLQPFIILFAVPLLFVGAFPALVAFARGQFGFLETLGVIVLIGVVENVAIFLIDFANQRVELGWDKRDAIALSSGIRLRPIVLTQLTSMAGLLPLAVFSPFWRGMAVLVIAGIISSGILTLFTTPVLYAWLTPPRFVYIRRFLRWIFRRPLIQEVHTYDYPAYYPDQHEQYEHSLER